MMMTSLRLAESSRKAPSRRLIKSTEAMTRGSALQGLEPASSDRRATATPSLFENLELEAELGRQFRLPLLDDGRGTDDQYTSSTATGVQLTQDEAGLDGFAEAHVIGNEKPWAWQFQRSQRRDLLIWFEFNAGASRGYQAIVTGRQTEPYRIHQKLEPRQPAGLSQVEFRDVVRINILDGMKDADLVVAE